MSAYSMNWTIGRAESGAGPLAWTRARTGLRSTRYRGHRSMNWMGVRWRTGIFAAAAAAVAAAMIPVAVVGQESGAATPNVVFIITDDMSWAHMGAYGNDEIDTPNLDRLAGEGVIFENAFVSTPSCTPSRASILTGRNGFELEEGASLWGYLPAKFPTYTELLAEQGYRVGATGKGWAPGFLIDRDVNPGPASRTTRSGTRPLKTCSIPWRCRISTTPPISRHLWIQRTRIGRSRSGWEPMNRIAAIRRGSRRRQARTRRL